MKKLLVRIIRAYERAGNARAAAELSRMGYYKEAKEIMLRNT